MRRGHVFEPLSESNHRRDYNIIIVSQATPHNGVWYAYVLVMQSFSSLSEGT